MPQRYFSQGMFNNLKAVWINNSIAIAFAIYYF